MSTAPSISIKRHYQRLSEEETDELVGALADLIVAYVKRRGGGQRACGDKPSPRRNEVIKIGGS